MKLPELRELLVERTIATIGTLGLDKTTTKAVTSKDKINEAYIYRCFDDKEDMVVKSFQRLDEELLAAITNNMGVLQAEGKTFEERCWLLFSALWKFLNADRVRCLAYVQYYYSPYFQKHSVKDHNARYLPLLDTFKPFFREEANVWMILNHLISTMFDFVIRIHDNAVADDDDTAQHVFNLVYISAKYYFKEDLK